MQVYVVSVLPVQLVDAVPLPQLPGREAVPQQRPPTQAPLWQSLFSAQVPPAGNFG